MSKEARTIVSTILIQKIAMKIAKKDKKDRVSVEIDLHRSLMRKGLKIVVVKPKLKKK